MSALDILMNEFCHDVTCRPEVRIASLSIMYGWMNGCMMDGLNVTPYNYLVADQRATSCNHSLSRFKEGYLKLEILRAEMIHSFMTH